MERGLKGKELTAGCYSAICCSGPVFSADLELVHLLQYCNRMELQMLTDGKPTNLIKTHALLY